MQKESLQGEIQKLLRNDIPDQFNERSFIKSHYDRISLILNGKVVPPFEIIIHPATRCNLKCIWCVGQHIDSYTNDEMPQNLKNPDSMLRLLHGILSYRKVMEIDGKEKEYKIERIQFSGLTGEPLFHKAAVLAGVNYLNDEGCFTGLFTNGMLMDELCWEPLSKINYVLVSVDAGSNESYNHMKCGGTNPTAYDDVCKNIEGLVDTRDRQGGNVDVNVGYVLNPYNYSEIYQSAKRMKELGVHFFRIKTDIANRLVLDDRQIAQAEEQLASAKKLETDKFKIVQIHKQYHDEEKKRHFAKCYMNTIMSAVSSDGNIYPCNYYAKNWRQSYGNAIETPFGELFEEKLKYDIGYPAQCPAVCDPYKNRSNSLIQKINTMYQQHGKYILLDLLKEI